MNRTNSQFSVKKPCVSVHFFLALALVLPFFTGQIPLDRRNAVSDAPADFACRLRMRRPVGAVVGFIAPLLRMVMFGMPPFYVAIAMAFELLTYGLVSGIMYRKVFKSRPSARCTAAF